MNKEPVVAIDYVTVLRATKRALLCDINNEEHWIPRRFLLMDEGCDLEFEGDEGLLVIPANLAEEKGIA